MKRLWKIFGLLVCVFVGAQAWAVEWERLSSYPTVVDLNSVVHGEGVFVAAGGNEIIYSLDAGKTWREVSWASGIVITSLAYGNGKFVAVTSDGRALVSEDGISWSSHSVLTGSLMTMVFGNGLFVAGATAGTIATSVDGVSWNLITGVGAGNIDLSAYGNNRFVLHERASASPGNVIISTNGVDWTRTAVTGIPTFICFPQFGCTYDLKVNSLIFGAGGFVLLVDYIGFSEGTRMYDSSDGVSWEMRPSVPPGYGNLVFYEGGQYIVPTGSTNGFVGPDFHSYHTPTLYASVDHMSIWTTHPLAAVTRDYVGLRAVEFDGSTFVAVGTGGLVVYGSSVETMERVDNPEKFVPLSSVASHGDTIVGVGTEMIVSTNRGRSFAKVSLPVGFWSFNSVRYQNGKFVAVGNPGAAFYSVNGIHWSQAGTGVSEELLDVEFANGKWVAVGVKGRVIASSDGTSFTPKNSGIDVDLNGVAGGTGRFVAVGDSGSFLTSADTESWTLTSSVEGTDLWSVAYGNSRFMAVGDGGRVYVSADGAEWSSRRIIGATTLRRVAFARGLFLTVELETEKTFTSPDGTNWTQVNIVGVSLLGANASEGRLYVSGSPNIPFSSAGYGTSIYMEKMETVLLLNGIIGSDRRMELSWPVFGSGNYTIFAAPDLSGEGWEQVGTAQVGEWKDTNALSGSRFYRVRSD